jgi:hypothetical protein
LDGFGRDKGNGKAFKGIFAEGNLMKWEEISVVLVGRKVVRF